MCPEYGRVPVLLLYNYGLYLQALWGNFNPGYRMPIYELWKYKASYQLFLLPWRENNYHAAKFVHF